MGGAVIRYSLVDTKKQEAMFDTPLHDAGDFDAVTNVWVHVVLVVTPTSLATYDDGYLFPSNKYGFFKNQGDKNNNLAQPDPAKLSLQGSPASFSKFDFASDLVLGGRADKHKDRHFQGKLALVNVFIWPLSTAQVQCLFKAGDAALPDPNAGVHCKPKNPCTNNGQCVMQIA